jgi:Tfp pilus assembly PilM family ATPase
MKAFLLWLGRHQIAVDHGSQRIKLLLTETTAHGVRARQSRIIDLQEEGLLTEDEVRREVGAAITELGEHPLALAVPQPLCISQVLDLPVVAEPEIKKLIEGETVTLGGVSEGAVLYDYRRLNPFGRHKHPHWLTISREESIQQQLQRVTAAEADLKELTPAANALVGAYLASDLDASAVVLADLGARSTVVALLLDGQCVFAASFPKGSEAFTRALAAARECSREEAEALKRTQDFLTSPKASPGLGEAVDGWFHELEKLLKEWRDANPDLAARFVPCRVVLSGGGARQPGLLEYLACKNGFAFAPWPVPAASDAGLPSGEFAIAFGAAVEAARETRHASLLPARLKANHKRLQQLMIVNALGLVLLGLTAVVLAFGLWQKASLVKRKKALIEQADLTYKQARQIEMLAQRRNLELERLTPLLSHQKHTLDSLAALHALQQARAQREFWFVLLADQQSYARGATLQPLGTNAPPDTNLFVQANPPPSKPGLIAELCIPADNEKALKTLSDLVTELKRTPAFKNVDALAANERKQLVDPKVLVPDRHFALAIEPKEADWLPLAPAPRPPETRSGTNGTRRPVTPARPKAERNLSPPEKTGNPSGS